MAVTDETRTSWQRLWRLLLPRATAGNLLTAVIALALGVAVVAQVRTTDAGDLSQLRESELVALLDDVSTRSDELAAEVRQLQLDRTRLLGGEGEEAARQAAQQRLDTYRILAGTVPAVGPGVRVSVQDPASGMTPSILIDAIQELRDAGAEAIQIGEVRVVASTHVGGGDGAPLTVDGTAVGQPYSIRAIGDPSTLATALAIPGGFNDTVRRVGGTVLVTEVEELSIDALHEPTTHRYARPVPADDP